jgi:hypothetical protein
LGKMLERGCNHAFGEIIPLDRGPFDRVR